jgi:hypothetical protein
VKIEVVVLSIFFLLTFLRDIFKLGDVPLTEDWLFNELLRDPISAPSDDLVL